MICSIICALAAVPRKRVPAGLRPKISESKTKGGGIIKGGGINSVSD